MAATLRKLLGLPDQPTSIITLDLNCQGSSHRSQCRKNLFTVQYLAYLQPVEQSEVLVGHMRASDMALGLVWFHSRNPEVDWQHCRLLAQQTSGGAEVVAVDQADHQKCPGNVPGSTAGEQA